MSPSMLHGSVCDAILDLSPQDVVSEPFPHVLKQPILDPLFYKRLREEFPADSTFDGRGRLLGARTGRDLYRGEPAFDALLASSPAWRRFHDYISSPAFLALALDLFGAHMKRAGCAVDPGKAHLVEHVEGRLQLWWRSVKARFLSLGRGRRPDDLWVRFDIEQGAPGYGKPVHCDMPNRLVSLIVYFCDADEIGMQGGELGLHEPVEKRPLSEYERHPTEAATRLVRSIRPRENLGLFFLCTNHSYHSVSRVESLRDYRRFIYLNLSSSADEIW